MSGTERASPESPLYVVGRDDLARAAEVLTEAFRGDPFFEYIACGKDADAGRVRHIHRFTLSYGMRYGRVLAPSTNIEGVAIWLCPGRTEMTVWRSLVAGVVSARKAAPTGPARLRFYSRMRAYEESARQLHLRNAPLPHWYLMVIGIGEAYRGKGFAGRLLRPTLARCDVEHLPCYLETHSAVNLPIYEHFGFKVAEEGRLPGTDLPHWAMVREADAGAGARLLAPRAADIGRLASLGHEDERRRVDAEP